MELTNSTQFSAAPALFQTRQPAHRDRHQVARHLLAQNIRLVLRGEQFIFLEAVVLRHADGLRRKQLLVRALHREGHRINEFIIGGNVASRYRQSSLFDQVLGHIDGCGGIPTYALHQRAGAFQLMLELAREFGIRISDRQIGSGEYRRQRFAAREAKPAGAKSKHRGCRECRATPYSKTHHRAILHDHIDELAAHHDHLADGGAADELAHMGVGQRRLAQYLLARRHRHRDPGAQFAVHLHDDLGRRLFLRSAAMWSANAASRNTSSPAATGTVIRARSLPFTCTTIWAVACSSASASTAVHGSSINARLWPNALHITWVPCGMMGESVSTAISNASCLTLRSEGVACGNLTKLFRSSMTAAIAVLNVRRRPMSSVTLARVWCAWRLMARCPSFTAVLSSGAGVPPATCS